MKYLLFITVLMQASIGLTQELTGYQQQKVEKEVEEMTQVMELSERQVKKVTKIKFEEKIESKQIGLLTERGSAENKTMWEALLSKYNEQYKASVSQQQWNEWLAYTCKKCNKPKSDVSNSEHVEQSVNDLTKNEFYKEVKEEVDQKVAEIVQVMSLYPDQEEAVRSIQLKLAIDIKQMHKTTVKGPERIAAHKRLTKAAGRKILEMTSQEQFDALRAHWKAIKEKK